jgi:large subunit ribosomal protein L32e
MAEKKENKEPKTDTGSKDTAAKETSSKKETSTESKSDKAPAPRLKIKPELDDATREALALRAELKKRTPNFRRPEWFRYKKLSRSGWRRPYGISSKQRRHYGYRPNVVSIGYGSPAAVRGLHPSGFREVLVHNVKDLEKLDPKTEAARIGGAVGSRKRELIMDAADRLKIRVLNPLRDRGEGQ